MKKRILPTSGWRALPEVWLLLPTALVIGLVLALSGQATPASASKAPQPKAEVSLQEAQPMCQSCHANEYAVWKGSSHASATLDPVFQAELAKSGNQDACLKCHTTGFDTGSGKFMSEGVTCEACHGPFKQGHPAAETMQLPMASDTCRMCHEAAFTEWEASKHAAQKIECFDCHLAHTQGLRTGSEEKLCGACHSNEQTQLVHSRHGINGVNCTSCHMAQEMKTTANPSGMQVQVRDHSFAVGADVCNGCHGDTIHTSAKLTGSAQVVPATEAHPQEDTKAQDLEGQVNQLQKRVVALRDAAVLGLGLAFGLGGFAGLLGGIIVMVLWQHRRRSA